VNPLSSDFAHLQLAHLERKLLSQKLKLEERSFSGGNPAVKCFWCGDGGRCLLRQAASAIRRLTHAK
jgi:hypothetical protein